MPDDTSHDPSSPWSLRWDDEPWVKQYQRQPVEWDALPWEARGLGQLLWGKLDRAGIMRLGRLDPPRAVAVALGDASAADRIRPQLEALLAVGWCIIRDGTLVVPHFLAAQEARQSDRARAQRHRDRERALGQKPARRTRSAAGADVTPPAADEAEGDAPVTPRDAGVTTRTDQPDPDHDQELPPAGARARDPLPPPADLPPVDLGNANWWRISRGVLGRLWDEGTQVFMPDAQGLGELQLHVEGLLQRQPGPVDPHQFIRDFLAAFMRLQAAWASKGFAMNITPWKAREHSSLIQQVMRGQLQPEAIRPPGGRPAAAGGRLPITRERG